MSKRVELAAAVERLPASADRLVVSARQRRAVTLTALEAVCDKSLVRLIMAALETRSQVTDAAERRRKLQLTDLVRQSAVDMGVDYKPFNAWLVNVFLDEDLLQESESIT